MNFIAAFDSRDGNAPWNPVGIGMALLVIIPFSFLALGTAAACTINDFAWGDHTQDPSFGKR